MFKNTILFLLLFFSSFNMTYSQNNTLGQKIVVNYTIPPNMAGISGILNNDKIYTGGLHEIIAALTKTLNINLNVLHYESFDKTIQNTIINNKNSPAIIVGIPYDEKLLKYFDYISFPIFNDFLVLVYDKTQISKIKTGKTIDETLNILKQKGKFLTLANFNIPYKIFENVSLNNTSEIFNKVLNDKYIFITTDSILNGYMETETNKNKFQNLVIIKYKKIKIPLFIAVNKNSHFYHKKYNETKTFFNVLTDSVKNYVNETNQKSTTDLKKTF